MKLGICAGPTAWSEPPAGLDFLEGHVQSLLVPRADEAEFAPQLETIQAACVPMTAANCFLPGSLPCTGPRVDQAALDAYVTTAMQRARRAGIHTIVFGSGGSRRVPEGFDYETAIGQIVGHLKRWGPLAGDHGVTIVLEPLNQADCNIITSIAEGADVVRRADHPAVRLLADSYHMALDNDPPSAIADAADLIGHVHVSELQGRAAPGVHGEDLTPYLAPLAAAGYAGGVSMECNWDNLVAQAPAALAALREQIDRA